MAQNPDDLERARSPRIVTGRGIIADILPSGTRFALLSQPGPRRALGEAVVERAAWCADAASLAADDLAALARSMPPVDLIVGAGGGVAMDTAKYIAWTRGLPVMLAPTIVSVDACVTNTIAVRRGGTVTYEGFVVAEAVVVDFDIIRSAPASLNRAGVGDLLSAHTAIRDWRLAADRGRVAWDEDVAASSARILGQIDARAEEIAAVSDVGIEALVRGYAEMNALCLQVGHSQPEEGSEHYFAYLAERIAGRSFVHGEVVGLGTVLMAAVQQNSPEAAVELLRRCGVAWHAPQLGLTGPLVARILQELPQFVREASLPWSVINEVDDRSWSAQLPGLVSLAGF